MRFPAIAMLRLFFGVILLFTATAGADWLPTVTPGHADPLMSDPIADH